MYSLLFSTRGRIRRLSFWIAGLILGIIIGGLSSVVSLTLDNEGQTTNATFVAGAFASVLGLVAIWIGICLGVKRYHDRDKSGFWILIQFVPIIGPIWYFVEAGCLRGTAGFNRFGSDPLSKVA